MKEIPRREAFFKPVLQALVELGGSGTNDEINNKVISLMNIPENILNVMHGETLQTELTYQLAWVRTMLKNQGSIENSKRGVWSIINIEDVHFLLKNTSDRTLVDKINQQLEEDENWKELGVYSSSEEANKAIQKFY